MMSVGFQPRLSNGLPVDENFEISPRKKFRTMSFRDFLRMIWEEHKEEVFNWDGKDPTYDVKDYFNRHKWWLKRLYKQQHRKGE